jgi:ubiquinol-cytochrome c reductase cytochrome c1 subunit
MVTVAIHVTTFPLLSVTVSVTALAPTSAHVNELLSIDNVAMPHVLLELQGYQKAKTVMQSDGQGGEHEVVVGFELIEPGSQSKSEYDQTVHDLVAFLDYLAEPYKQTRKNVGTGVIIFLLLLLILTYFLKKEYWKDIH